MGESRTSSRIFKEFRLLYELRPELNVRANDELFMQRALDGGLGYEDFTAENAILWLDEPEFRSKLAVLQETPQQAMEKWLQQNPAYDSVANRELFERSFPVYGDFYMTLSALDAKHRLSFDKAVADEQTEKALEAEVAGLVDELVQQYSPSPTTQALYRKSLLRITVDELRVKAAEARERKFLRGLSAEQLKAHLKNLHAQNAPPPVVLPAEITPTAIKRMEPNDIRKLNRVYGEEVVNARLAGVS